MSFENSREQVLQQPGVYNMIAERAYYISEKAGFAPHRDMDFWLQAENEMLSEWQTQSGANGTAKKTRKPAVKAAASAEPKVAKAKAAPRKRATKKAE
jgi:hypothetical protein